MEEHRLFFKEELCNLERLEKKKEAGRETEHGPCLSGQTSEQGSAAQV